jgi:hypothetical protein
MNGCEIPFVKDAGAEMTLIREEYVDSNNIIEGQRVTLYTILCYMAYAITIIALSIIYIFV